MQTLTIVTLAALGFAYTVLPMLANAAATLLSVAGTVAQ